MAELMFITYGPHDRAYDNPHFIVIETSDSVAAAQVHYGGLTQEEYLSKPVSAPMTLEDWQQKVTGRKSLLFFNTWGYYNSQRKTAHSEVVRPKRSQFAPGSSRRSGSKPRMYRLPVGSSAAFGSRNPCDKGYSPKKIKGRWYCVKQR